MQAPATFSLSGKVAFNKGLAAICYVAVAGAVLLPLCMAKLNANQCLSKRDMDAAPIGFKRARCGAAVQQIERPSASHHMQDRHSEK